MIKHTRILAGSLFPLAKREILLAFGLAIACALAPGLSAQVPGIMNYQGTLTSYATNYTGTASLKFALVDGGTQVARRATATATVTSGFITSFTVTDPGAYYTSEPTVRITDKTGSGAVGVAQISGGLVTGILVKNPGTGYTAPVVSISAPANTYSYVTLWSNDGTSSTGSEPTNPVLVSVKDGLFNLNIGDTNLANMTAPLSPDVFANADVRLRIWVGTDGGAFQQLSPDQRVTASGYSLIAARVADSAVIGTGNLAPLAVTTDKLAGSSVNGAKILDGTIATADLADGSVTTAKLENGAVTAAKLAPASVSSSTLMDNSITDADVSPTAKIAMSKISGGPGIEFGSFSGATGLATNVTTVGQITVSCPTAGYVLVTLTGQATIFGDSTAATVGVSKSTSAFASSVNVGRLDGTGTQRFYAPFSVSYVFLVSAGDNTFYGLAQKISAFDACYVNIGSVYMTGLFVSNRY